MTLHDWFWVLFTITGGLSTLLTYVRREIKSAKLTAALKVDNEKRALDVRLDTMQRECASSLYNAKKDVFDKIKEDRDVLNKRCEQLEREHEQGRNEFTTELRNIVETFTRTCDGLQTKLEHLTSTIIGQYVPRAEIDNRFNRNDEKQDKILNILYEMKK